MTAAPPDMWQEVFLFSIEILDGSEIQYAGITEDITTFPDLTKDVEGVALANGGRRMKWTPQGDLEFTVKVTPIDCKIGAAGVAQLFNPQATADATDPIKVLGTRTRNPHQIIFTWAEDAEDLTTAGTETTADKQAYRFTAKNCYMTKYQLNSDDKNITAEITFKCAPFGRTGNANYKEESTESTAIPVKTDFTTANQFSAM